MERRGILGKKSSHMPDRHFKVSDCVKASNHLSYMHALKQSFVFDGGILKHEQTCYNESPECSVSSKRTCPSSEPQSGTLLYL